MAINSKYVDLLYRAQDAPLSPEEERELSQALEQSAELRATQERLLKLRKALSDLQPAPDPAFTGKVMARMEEGALLQPWLRRVAAACFLLIAAAFVSLYLSEGSLSTDTLIGVEELQPEDATALTGSLNVN
jgi:ferric-dicitrate binding protein FerR (iron transport regulator)